MKKIIYLAVAVSSLLFTACGNFLDTQDLTHKNTSNFPKTVVDAQQMLTGVYENLNEQFDNHLYGNIPSRSFWFYAEVASDDRLGGGGPNDQGWQAEDMFLQYSNSDMYRMIWQVRYMGVYRANFALENYDKCTGYTDSIQKYTLKGETHFLRAFYYYELASMFENIPLTLSSTPVNLAQATPATTWGQIMTDLKQAVALLPATKTTAANAGHADKYAAEALLARAYLFYDGFYKANAGADVALADGTTLTKQNVIDALKDVVTNSGYQLVLSDYRNLWPYTNSLTKEDYAYTKGQNLLFVGDKGAANPESMFAVKFSNFAKEDGTASQGYSNQIALYMGMRGNQNMAGTFPFGQGWGGGPVAPNLWNDWKAADPTNADMRRAATICDIPTELAGGQKDANGVVTPNYQYGQWGFIQETDYYMKKTSAIVCKKADGTYANNFEAVMYNNTTSNLMQNGNTTDLVYIRYADVLLMLSELTADPSYMNQVRARVGLPTIGYSLAALQNERRFEFAGEAIRWNDMRRWGDTYCKAALDRQLGVAVYTNGKPAVNSPTGIDKYSVRYGVTHGFVMIPGSEIALSNGVLKQNSYWVTAPDYPGWPNQ